MVWYGLDIVVCIVNTSLVISLIPSLTHMPDQGPNEVAEALCKKEEEAICIDLGKT